MRGTGQGDRSVKSLTGNLPTERRCVWERGKVVQLNQRSYSCEMNTAALAIRSLANPYAGF